MLIVEDDQNQREYLIDCAYRINPKIKVLSTDSYNEAIKIIEKNDIKIVFIDIQLIDGNGMDLAKYIRKISKYQFTPIVFITGTPTKEMEALHEIHCYDYILKPFTKTTLEKVMSHILIDYLEAYDKANQYVCLDFKGLKQKINSDDILFIESRNRKIIIRTKYEEIIYKHISLQTFMKELPEHLIQVHQSFIVNKDHMEKINQYEKSISLVGIKTKIPIGVSYKKIVGEQSSGII